MKSTDSNARPRASWTMALTAISALGLAALVSTGRADGGNASIAFETRRAEVSGEARRGIAPARGEAAKTPDRGAAASPCAAPAGGSEPGDWNLLPERFANDRAARLRAIELLASGEIPVGKKRSDLVSWLRATNDPEEAALLESVLRDLEARRYAAAATDADALLRRVAEGDESARREAIETIRPELLALDSVQSMLKELASDDSTPALARAAIQALANSDDPETTAFLAARVAEAGAPPATRAAAAGAIALRKSEIAAKTLVERLADPAEDVIVKRLAAQGLRMQDSGDAVVRALTDAYHGELDFTIRFNAVAGLEAHAARPDVRRELESVLATDPSDDIRAMAMMALAMVGHDVDRVIALGRRDSSPKVRDMAASFGSVTK